MNIKEQTQFNNPFYDNHVFTKEDLRRATITLQDKMWLWLHPTYVQISSEGIVFHYKNVAGKIYITKIETLAP